MHMSHIWLSFLEACKYVIKFQNTHMHFLTCMTNNNTQRSAKAHGCLHTFSQKLKHHTKLWFSNLSQTSKPHSIWCMLSIFRSHLMQRKTISCHSVLMSYKCNRMLRHGMKWYQRPELTKGRPQNAQRPQLDVSHSLWLSCATSQPHVSPSEPSGSPFDIFFSTI